MSTIRVEFRSQALTRPASFWMFYPEKLPEEIFGPNPHYDRPMKTLILLHGYTGNSGDWLYHGGAAELSMKYNLAVVMPDGGISFYLDRPGMGNGYCRFIGEDLPQYLQNTFGLAKSKEDTLIGGNSMGGFGALHTALAYPEQFGCAIGLSSALVVRQVAALTPDKWDGGMMADYPYYLETFGDPAKVLESPQNPEFLVKELKCTGKEIPRLFMACGTEDFLLQQNREFHQFLVDENVPVTYLEDSGVHDWAFWNKMIGPALDWALPV